MEKIRQNPSRPFKPEILYKAEMEIVYSPEILLTHHLEVHHTG